MATYRADGLRGRKISSGASTYFLYDGSVPIAELSSTGSVKASNTWGADGLVSRHSGTTSAFYSFDPLGSLAVATTSTGAVSSSSVFDSFGKRTSTVGLSSGYTGFGGQVGNYTDSETGLTLMGERYYDAGAGRFLTRDPLGYGGGINLYSYTQNNPVNESDPSGLGPDYPGPNFDDNPVSQYLNQFGNGVDQMCENIARPIRRSINSWDNAWGAFRDWAFGSGSDNRSYGPDSTQSESLKNSRAGDEIRDELSKGHFHPDWKHPGSVSTPGAFKNTLLQPWNGTQAQVGGFLWTSQPNSWGGRDIDAYNRMSFYSFFYHGPGFQEYPRSVFRPMGNIEQHFHWSEP